MLCSDFSLYSFCARLQYHQPSSDTSMDPNLKTRFTPYSFSFTVETYLFVVEHAVSGEFFDFNVNKMGTSIKTKQKSSKEINLPHSRQQSGRMMFLSAIFSLAFRHSVLMDHLVVTTRWHRPPQLPE